MNATTTDKATDHIREIADRAGFDDSIGDLATQVFTNAVSEGVVEQGIERDDGGKFSGDDRQYPAASYPAAVYAAARVRDIPTKPDEVVGGVSEAPEKRPDVDDVTRHYKAMLRALPYTVEPEDPVDWVRRICDELDVGPAFENDAVELCGDAVAANLHTGKSVSGFSASVVYATSEYRDAGVGQDDITDVVSLSPVTIRNQYRDILSLWEDAAEAGDPAAIDAAINDICDRIDGLPGKVRAAALELANDAIERDAEFVERTDPKGVAAGFVYVAGKDARVDVSQTEVADVASVSKSTVVNRVNDGRDWRRRASFEGVNYNDLKRIAAEHDVDVGETPEREYLIDRLVEAGVEQ